MTISTILVILALVAFVLAGVGWKYKKTDLIAIGLALWLLSRLVIQFHILSVYTIILILAFIAFVLAAVGWGYKKTSLIAIGLALWMLALLVGPLVG